MLFRSTNPSALKALIDAKADVNATDESGHTALFYANSKEKKAADSKEAKETIALLAAAGALKK